jgi:hypothetical protein
MEEKNKLRKHDLLFSSKLPYLLVVSLIVETYKSYFYLEECAEVTSWY